MCRLPSIAACFHVAHCLHSTLQHPQSKALTLLRNFFKEILDTSTPSMTIFPPSASAKRNIANINVDLPAPVRPTG